MQIEFNFLSILVVNNDAEFNTFLIPTGPAISVLGTITFAFVIAQAGTLGTSLSFSFVYTHIQPPWDSSGRPFERRLGSRPSPLHGCLTPVHTCSTSARLLHGASGRSPCFNFTSSSQH